MGERRERMGVGQGLEAFQGALYIVDFLWKTGKDRGPSSRSAIRGLTPMGTISHPHMENRRRTYKIGCRRRLVLLRKMQRLQNPTNWTAGIAGIWGHNHTGVGKGTGSPSFYRC